MIFKKIILFLCALGLSLPVFANLKVFACEPEWAALVNTLGTPHVSVTQATTALQDPHQIEARPSLTAQARRADLIVCTGAELESGWLPMIQAKANNPKILSGQPGHFMAADYVKLLDVPTSLDRSHGDVHASGNPHIQLDPRNYLPIAKALAARLSQLDPKHANVYEANYQHFKYDWEKALITWQQQAKQLQAMPIVVYHHSWTYLNDWLGLKQVSTLEPKPGIPPSAAHLSNLYTQIHDQNIKAIICSPYESQNAAKWLSQKTNIPVIVLPFTVGGSKDASDLKTLFDVTLAQLTMATTHG
ncbi:MAG TPA: zinc ABC transporter substrate-binding protein [Candidatus Berkiella sp.]|nr:zinc ABC transporter substrate-binding protein [Candidatus Berkiella sp.]